MNEFKIAPRGGRATAYRYTPTSALARRIISPRTRSQWHILRSSAMDL